MTVETKYNHKKENKNTSTDLSMKSVIKKHFEGILKTNHKWRNKFN